MEKDKFGIPRPLVSDGKGPTGFERPLAKNKENRLIAELESAIEDEKTAGVEYQRVINQLMKNGFEQEADQVRQIRQQERKHREQFESILSKIRRETSY